MRLNILIGGKAGQGINKVSEIVSKILAKHGYFSFNSRDYQSLIRGGHNFNVLSISDKWIGSNDSVLDGIISLDENTFKIHKKELKNDGFIIKADGFEELGRNINIALASVLIKILGIEKKFLLEEIKHEFDNKEAIEAAEKGYETVDCKYCLLKRNEKIKTFNGTQGVALGAINSGINIYFAYPMTPATPLMNELASYELEKNLLVFQPEGEIAAINQALGASFAGARTMVGTSGGGFDLMTEALSFQGQSEIPLVVYLASRPGPSTGIPTYTSQADLNVALRAGHGEFPRVVIAPGDPIECIEKTNEAFYLSQKFNLLCILLTDKHLAEAEFSLNKEANKNLKIESNRKFPGEAVVKASSYEHNEKIETIEDAETAKRNADKRIEKYKAIKKEARKFEMLKIHGNKNSKNIIVSWGSTKGAILDAIDGLDVKFLQILYLKPMSDELQEQLKKAKNIILVENNSTGQLGYLIREKTGIKIDDKILRYDGRPFLADELREEIKRRIK